MIRTRSLTVELGGRQVLKGIDLDVGPGESVGLVGPNGSGKSTLLRALVGLVPFTGEASVCGRDVVSEPIQSRLRVAYVPQRCAFGSARAREVLEWIAALRGIERARIATVLREVGLFEHRDEPAKTLSGGQQQRLSLACALLTDAPVLLFDEPTASLDVDGQRTFAAAVSQLRGRGRTLLIASHRPDEVALLTDRAVILDGGALVRPEALEESRVVQLPVGGKR